jgi:sensor histidine kinase YesM
MERRWPVASSGRIRHLGTLATVSLPISFAASPLMQISYYAARYFFGVPHWLPGDLFFSYRGLSEAEAIYWCSIAGGYFFRTQHQLREQERTSARLALEKSQLEASLNQAQLQVLRARLNPHFLFNSLQNIGVLIRQDPQTASRMLTRLGDLLRAVLRHDSDPETTLVEELDLTRAYVAVEQMRFGDHLYVDFEIAPQAHLAMVPCFLLQPFVENAIIHGLAGARKTGLISIAAAIANGELLLSVADNGVGLPLESETRIKNGLGLSSTRERLERMYPDRHRFSIRTVEGGGTEVRIAIPLQQANSDVSEAPNEHATTVDS